jgi:hypothetical protein
LTASRISGEEDEVKRRERGGRSDTKDSFPRYTRRVGGRRQVEEVEFLLVHRDDYGIWKLRAMGHLATKDLFGVDLEIDGWVKKNPSILKECARDEVMEKYDESQEKRLLILYSLLDTSVIKKLGKVTTAQEAFTKLEEIYEKQGRVEVIVLIHKLVLKKMAHSHSTQELRNVCLIPNFKLISLFIPLCTLCTSFLYFFWWQTPLGQLVSLN